jgi:hypothetical protein
MTESLYVNADWSALVPADSPDAAFGITPKDAKRRGLLPLDEGETLGEPEMLLSANAEPQVEQDEAVADADLEVKQAPTPANKAAKKPANK